MESVPSRGALTEGACALLLHCERPTYPLPKLLHNIHPEQTTPTPQPMVVQDPGAKRIRFYHDRDYEICNAVANITNATTIVLEQANSTGVINEDTRRQRAASSSE